MHSASGIPGTILETRMRTNPQLWYQLPLLAHRRLGSARLRRALAAVPTLALPLESEQRPGGYPDL